MWWSYSFVFVKDSRWLSCFRQFHKICTERIWTRLYLKWCLPYLSHAWDRCTVVYFCLLMVSQMTHIFLSVGFLRSGTNLFFRRRHRQKDASFSQSHEDISNLGSNSASAATISRKKSGSFSRRLIKRFSFRSSSKSKDKASATNGGASTADNWGHWRIWRLSCCIRMDDCLGSCCLCSSRVGDLNFNSWWRQDTPGGWSLVFSSKLTSEWNNTAPSRRRMERISLESHRNIFNLRSPCCSLDWRGLVKT